jgi:hypothetical protein
VVTNQTVPLSNVVVTSYEASSHAFIQSVLTNAAGEYSMSVPVGVYHIRYTNTVPASLSQYFDHKTSISAATTITAPGGITLASSDLGPNIQGTIVNQGVPISGAGVSAYDANTHAFVKGVSTNASGFYSMSLPAGSYHIRFYVAAQPSLTQYNDHKALISDATVIAAPGGVINVSSDLGPSLQGTLTNEGVPIGGAGVSVYDATTHAFVKAVSTNTSGFYSMSLLTGSYHIRFYVAAQPLLTQYYDHKATITDATMVSAASGLINVSSDLGPTIQGVVTNEGVVQNGVGVTAFDATTHASVKSVVTNASGYYTMSVPIGTYHIRYTGTTPASLSQFNDHMNTISEATTISAPAGIVSLSTDLGPVVRGIVTNLGSPLSGVVVTAFDSTTHSSVKTVVTNSSGSYTMALPTGTYHIRFTVTSPASLSQYYDHKSTVTDAAVVSVSTGAVGVSSDLGAAP